MTSNAKLVSAPLKIEDMDQDLDSKTVYIFDYEKSSIKGLEFLNYIKNSSVIADIYISQEVAEYTKSLLLEKYMTSPTFYHITSFNLTILNLIYIKKGLDKRVPYSMFKSDEAIRFIENHEELLNDWIKVFDSLFMYMLNIVTLNDKDIFDNSAIRNRYDQSKIITDKEISPNVMAPLLDDAFYYYYQEGVTLSNVSYYQHLFELPLYDNKPLQALLYNDANFIIRILHDMIHNEEFQKYMLEQTQN